MLSVIETPESLAELAHRLAAWCIIETEDQRYNFRFADTRRLPAIYGVLRPEQKGQFAGPATRWAYIGRDGQWNKLAMNPSTLGIADRPKLDNGQFGILVDDSRVDELLTQLRDRGHDVYARPSISYAMINQAMRVGNDAQLAMADTREWCEWLWKNEKSLANHDVPQLLTRWQDLA